MDSRTRKSSTRRCILLASICVTIAAALLARPALAALPPRPDPETDPTGDDPSNGGPLILLVQFPQDWPWEHVHWQNLHTVVQWQDPYTGKWHDVQGWKGTLDTVEIDTSGLVTGKKTWWFGGKDLGTGPFRWLVYGSPKDSLLATSTAFNLPDSAGGSITITVAL